MALVTGDPAAASPLTTARRLPRQRLLLILAVLFGAELASVLTGARGGSGFNIIWDGILTNAIYVGAAMLAWDRSRRNAPDRVAWRILTLGLASYAAGWVYWTILVRPLDPRPVGTIADGLWLGLYPCAYVAILLLARRRTRQLRFSTWLDGFVAALGVAALGAALVSSNLGDGRSLADQIVTVGYPMSDLLLIVLLVGFVSVLGWRLPSGWWYLLGGLSLLALTDAALLGRSNPGARIGSMWDLGWPVAVVLIASAVGRTGAPARVDVVRRWPALLVPLGGAGTAIVLLAAHVQGILSGAVSGLAAGCLVAALGRIVFTSHELSALAASHALARSDELTGLPSRRALYDDAGELFGGTEQDVGTGQHALLLLDLDRFKEVNDSLGHRTGDVLLVHIAARLASQRSDGDLLARLGGDEFALILRGAGADDAFAAAEYLRAVLREPVTIDGVTLHVDASVGISLYPGHGETVELLLQHADIAMYQAKAYRDGPRIYSGTDAAAGRARLVTLDELRRGLREGELILHYQPKVDLASAQVMGVEALVRWLHPTRGLLSPDKFLGLAEEAGLMADLTDEVLRQALAQCSAWWSSGREISVAVNLSASTVVNAALPGMLAERLATAGLPARALQVEITEDVLMADRTRARAVLEQIRGLGIEVALDDFGSGYSSLSYLRELPVDVLKLDRSFVSPMSVDHRAAALVHSTVELAHSLGLRMVAEGVEDNTTLARLAAYGCDSAQGYFLCRPVPADHLDAWLHSQKARFSHSERLVG